MSKGFLSKTAYGLLTLTKFFTGIVAGVGDSTTRFVVKLYPTLGNHWSMGEETAANIAKHSSTWYFNKQYWTIASTESGLTFEPFYYLLIGLWWMMTILWLLNGLMQWADKKKRAQ